MDYERNDDDDDEYEEVLSLAFSISSCGPPPSDKSLMIFSFPPHTQCMGRFYNVLRVVLAMMMMMRKIGNINLSYSILVL